MSGRASGAATAGARRVTWTDLGRMPYAEAWALQRELVALRKAGQGVDRLLLVEHEPVLTAGRRAKEENIVAGRVDLKARGIAVHNVERGGDMTYHGPGQLVAYPILDLRGFRKDVRWYSMSLLEVVVRVLADFGVEGQVREGLETGVWVAEPGGRWGKIAALGVRIERWVTYHGFALNVDPDLSHFDLIVPCGLSGVRSVSMAGVLGRPVSMAAVRRAVVDSFGAVFDAEVVQGELVASGRLIGAAR